MTRTMTQPHPAWHAVDGARIWRAPDSSFHGNELDQAADVCSDEVLSGIAVEGFNGVWLRRKLHCLMDQHVLPSLNTNSLGILGDVRVVP